jgi:hypothetical protein
MGVINNGGAAGFRLLPGRTLKRSRYEHGTATDAAAACSPLIGAAAKFSLFVLSLAPNYLR